MGKIIELRVFSNMLDGVIAEGILRDAGIKCELTDQLMPSIYPVGGVINNSIKLLIYEEDRELAEEVLAAQFSLSNEGY